MGITMWKLLIPSVFGGGFLKGFFDDENRFVCRRNGLHRFDEMELLAFWNHDVINSVSQKPIGENLKYNTSEFPILKEIDNNTPYNSNIGLFVGWNGITKYPVIFAEAEYNGTYEDYRQNCNQTNRRGFNKYIIKKYNICA